MPYLVHLLSPQELTADDNSVMNNHLKMEIKTMNGKRTSEDKSGEIENADRRHDLTHQIKQTGPSEDQHPGIQPCEISFQPESRKEDLAGNGLKTKVIDPELNTESADRKDSCMSSLKHDEVMTATQSGKAHRNTRHIPSPDSQTPDSVLREDNAVDQQEISEVTGLTGSIDKVGTKEAKSVCTQTEECNREEAEGFGSPQQRPVVLHASTQTHDEQMVQSEKKEEESDECTESPPLSAAPASETERLLFSGSFPIPANPVHLAERIRRGRSRMSAAYDDTEYEPYGLPEVVMKGVQRLCSELSVMYLGAVQS